MVIKVNHSQAGGFAPLPVGEYECIIDGATYKRASTGSDMVAMKVKVRGDVPNQQGAGRVIFNNLVFNEKTAGMVQSFFKAVGIPDGHEFNSYEEIAQWITGKPIRAKLGIREYNGNENNEIKFVLAPKAGAPAPDLSQATDPFAGGPNLTPPVTADPFATGAYTPPADVTEDDMPF